MTQWVQQRDGSLQAFDADRICRALFAVSERLGRPDAFLARELTDGVIHFLESEASEATISSTDLSELIVKVVRELGQPHLARGFEQRAGSSPETEPVRRVPSVFSAELRSAQDAGLLVLGGGELPERLAAAVLPWPRTAEELVPALRRLAQVAEMLVLDGPEFWLQAVGRDPGWLTEQVALALRDRERDLVVNLHTMTAPPAVEAIAPGPLFASAGDNPAALAETARELALRSAKTPGRVIWHLLPGRTQEGGLHALLAQGAGGCRVEFVFSRRRRGVHLAEGVDRQEPALLLRVGLRLARLLGAQGREPDAVSYLHKVGTLARLALSAGTSKRAHLRRVSGAELSEGFLLDRARLQIVPMGLDVVVERMAGKSLSAGGQGLELGRKILQHLRDVLRLDGQKAQLPCCIEDAPPGALPQEDLPGLDIHDRRADIGRRIRAASLLQEISERGRLTFVLPPDGARAAPRILELLDQVGMTGEVDRVRFVPEEDTP